jgi:RHS repeat-associated protein
MKGDPINTATGNAYLQDEDYTDNSWLIFRRFYNSSPYARATTMGEHWSHSFNRALYIDSSSIMSFRPDGQYETFINKNGAWISDADSSNVLVKNDTQGTYTLFVSSLREFETYDTTGELQSVSDETGQGITLTYSTSSTPVAIAPTTGLLITVTDPRGRQLNFSYTSNGQVNEVIEPDGKILTYGYDGSTGNLVSVQYPDGKTRQYVYNEPSLTSGADLPSAMTGVVDETGARFESTSFNGSGQATSSSFAGNIDTTTILYNGDDTSTVQYPLGTSSTIKYVTSASGRINASTVNQPCGPQCGEPWQTRTYDTNGYPASYVDFNGNVVAVTYDANGLLDQQVEGSGSTVQRTTNTTWNTALRVPLTRQVLDAQNNLFEQSGWAYNIRGQTVAHCEIDPTVSGASSYTCAATGVVPAGVRRWTYIYCDAVDGTQCPQIGLLLSMTGPRTDLTQTTTYSYYMTSSSVNCGTPGAACYQAGDLHTVTDALGHSTTIASYDGAGRITRVTDANGISTDMAYNARGWLTSRTVDGTPTTITYWPYGAVSSITDPDGVVTHFTYDAAHRLTRVTDALGNYIQYTLDAAGNKTQEQTYTASGTLTRSLSRNFNNLGQLTALVDGLNHAVFNAGYSDSYDGNGNLVHTADALGVQRKQNYDALNRLISTLDNYNGTDPATQNTQVQYNFGPRGNLGGIYDPAGYYTQYSYNGFHDLTAVISPDSGARGDTLDVAGNHLTHTDARGVTSTSAYDALDRITSTTYTDTTQNISYHYDESNAVTGCNIYARPLGHLTRIVEGGVTTAFCFGGHGNLIETIQTTAGHTDTTSFTYDGADRLTAIVYPSGSRVSYGFDGDGRIQTVSLTPVNGGGVTAVSSVSYQPFGPISSYTLGNGQAVTRSYDANYRLTDLTSPALNLHFARDAMGDITALGNAPGANPALETYSYDPLYRLTAITEAGGSVLETATYNSTGDRTSKSGSGLATGTYSYNPNTHQLIGTGTATRSVDANGNTTAIAQAGVAYGFGYNARDRLTVAQLGGSTVGSYTYNALGQRIGKAAATTERFVYGEGSQLLSEYGTSNRDYVWLGDLPVATVDTSGTTSAVSYVMADHLGTPRAVADSSGNTVWQWAYQGNSWGELQPTSATGYTLNLRYPGQYYDAETGLSQNGFRDYDSASGRFAQADPTGLNGGINPYAYVGGNPLDYVDPDGLREVDVYIWHAQGSSLSTGHVMVTEENSHQVILSQFPANGMPIGKNVTKDFSDTIAAEGRPADSTWRINVPDDQAFDRAAAHERSLLHWTASPSKNSTQCSIAASRALQAGGVGLTAVTDGTLMPGFFDNNINKNRNNAGNNIQRLQP